MKKWFAFAALVLMLSVALFASAEEFSPIFAACTGEQVNVRVEPQEKLPSIGRLIRRAPVIVIGESDDESCWLCMTIFGEGYVPKQYIELFEDMTAEEFSEYCDEHPNFYRHISQLSNYELLLGYWSGEYSVSDLKKYWKREFLTGYLGWHLNKNGDIVLTQWHDYWTIPNYKRD